jgi:hypothetical protein
VAERSPNVFEVLSDNGPVELPLEQLEASLAGRLLLVRYRKFYVRRIFVWLWRSFRRHKDAPPRLRVVGDGPDLRGLEFQSLFSIAGGCHIFCMSQKVLEATWTGRLLLLEYRDNVVVQCIRYIWYDLNGVFIGLGSSMLSLVDMFHCFNGLWQRL